MSHKNLSLQIAGLSSDQAKVLSSQQFENRWNTVTIPICQQKFEVNECYISHSSNILTDGSLKLKPWSATRTGGEIVVLSDKYDTNCYYLAFYKIQL